MSEPDDRMEYEGRALFIIRNGKKIAKHEAGEWVPLLPGVVVRTTPDIELRHGMQIPLLVDLAHLFVFDRSGERICPAPERLPDLEE